MRSSQDFASNAIIYWVIYSCYISKMDFERTALISWFEKCAQWICDSTSIPFVSIFNEWRNKFNLDKHFDLFDYTSITRFEYQLRNCNKTFLLDWIKDIITIFDIKNNIIDDEKENLENFIEAIQSEEFKDYDLSMFSKIGKPINQVVLSTWFAAKGLEFDAIVLMGMDEGIMPDYKALNDEDSMQEQQRMCFVGVSRARKKCFLTRSAQYTTYSTKYHKYYTHTYQPSRFWSDLKACYCDQAQ
jgi:DNA helicase-2/ATP-dependent DNA helicase PcrA